MKILSTLCSFFVVIASFAQTAPDFTITTTDNVTRNLYNTLDQGKTVLLDFFYPSCQGCWYYSPVIEQSYQNHGSGTGNIEYWGINGGNEIVDDVAIIAYTQQYGITNPYASGIEGNGEQVDSLYDATFPGIMSYPTYAVICPDRTIYWAVNYPPVVTGFDSYFASCSATSAMDENQLNLAVAIYPNPTTGTFTVSGATGTIEVLDPFGRLILNTTESQIDMSQQPKGVYFVRSGEAVRKLVVQ